MMDQINAASQPALVHELIKRRLKVDKSSQRMPSLNPPVPKLSPPIPRWREHRSNKRFY